MKYFLALEVACTSADISLSPRKYVLELLQDVSLLGTKFAFCPMDQYIKFSKDDGDLDTCQYLYSYRDNVHCINKDVVYTQILYESKILLSFSV